MTDRVPVEVTNLDRYGSAALPWSRPHDLLAASSAGPDLTFFLGTVRASAVVKDQALRTAWWLRNTIRGKPVTVLVAPVGGSRRPGEDRNAEQIQRKLP